MKSIKKIVSMLLTAILTVSMLSSPVQAEFGVEYDRNYMVEWKNASSYFVYAEDGGVLGKVTYVVGVAKQKKSNTYTTLVKVSMEPNDESVKVGSLMSGWDQYAYGFSEYVSVNYIVPGRLEDYRPENAEHKDLVKLSLGDSIGISYMTSQKELDITAKCSTNENKCYMVYDYEPNQINPFADNNYVANESVQYMMASFEKNNDKQDMTVYVDARFGAAMDNQAMPWNIKNNYIRKGIKATNYTFTF